MVEEMKNQTNLFLKESVEDGIFDRLLLLSA